MQHGGRGGNLHNSGPVVMDAVIRNGQNLHLLKWKRKNLNTAQRFYLRGSPADVTAGLQLAPVTLQQHILTTLSVY